MDKTVNDKMSTNDTGMMRGVRYFFGIFMVLFYLAIAAALVTNVFNFEFSPMLRWVFGVLFGAYGIYRGYRLVTGQDFYGRQHQQDDEDDSASRYTTYAEELNKQQNSNDNDTHE